MTMRETIRAAAWQLVNCDSSNDAVADEQLRLAAALRQLAERITTETANARDLCEGCKATLARLTAPLVKP